jgi:site-specific DNA-methyltransferase (adenine-specific)
MLTALFVILTMVYRSLVKNWTTVKPTDLMRYLCRLVTQPNGIVLDAFMGIGSTGKAALLEGFCFIGIERDQEYFEIARRRINE